MVEKSQASRFDSVPSPVEFVTDEQLSRRYGVHRTTIWRWAGDPATGFPAPVHLSRGCTRWRLGECLQWERRREGKL